MNDIKEYFDVRNRFAPWHTLRYIESLEWLDSYLISGSSVLDLGGNSAFSDALKKFRGVCMRSNVPDLRYQFPFPDNSLGLVLCMEVLEHICDRGDSQIDIFTGSGIKNILSETFRVLRSGGHLFLTTPNVCCYNSVWRALQGKHPFSYSPHFRELAPADVVECVERAGFKVERYEVLDIWQGHNVPGNVVESINQISDKLQCEVARGDCTFILACKG